MMKIIAKYDWNDFQSIRTQKVLIKLFFFVFSRKNPDFLKKNLKNSKIHFFELRNPVGWVPHAVLALNQWIRPKNKGSKKTVPQM